MITLKRVSYGLIILLITLFVVLSGHSFSLAAGPMAAPGTPVAAPLGATPPPVNPNVTTKKLAAPRDQTQGGDCGEYIQNGSFESKTVWVASPINSVVYTNTNTATVDGSSLVYMVAYSTFNASLWQTVTITNAQSASLQFQAVPYLSQGDSFYVTVWDEKFQAAEPLYQTKLTFPLTGWNSMVVDLPAASLMNQKVNVVFQINHKAGNQPSFIYLDQVTLGVCVPSATNSNEIVATQANQNGHISMAEGQYLTVKLESNPSTGFFWEVATPDGNRPVVRAANRVSYESLRQTRTTLVTESVGQPVLQVLRFDPIQAGTTSLKLVYHQPNQAARANELTFNLEVQGVGGFANGSATKSAITATNSQPGDTPTEVNGQRIQRQSGSTPMVGLPQKFNWCDQGDCTPIKDQGYCGSCWAFATVGVMESQFLIKDKTTRDLSEQFLLSCNTDDYSCSDGGWWAYDYYWNKKSKAGSGPGVVDESDFRYQASDLSCPAGLTHKEKITSWGYVADNGDASVENLKDAIYKFGPISVAVCAGDAFSYYDSGIFNTEEADWYCGGGINHAVVLTGWDDATKTFNLRNSWNTGWGEQGNMRIAYNTSNIGLGASYVVYNGNGGGGSKPNTPLSLKATAAGNTINLAWTDNSDNETGFKVQRWNSTTSQFEQIGTTGAGVTSYADSGQCNTKYYYEVVATNGQGDSDASNMVDATTSGCGNLNAPTDFVAVAQANGGVSLQWRDNSDGEDRFWIARWDGTQWEWLPKQAANVTSYLDTTAQPSKYRYYWYIMITGNTSGYSNWSNYAAVLLPKSMQLAAPAAGKVSATQRDKVTLNWTNSDTKVEKFVIERWNSQQKSWVLVNKVTGQTSYTDSGLACNSRYYYMVYAANGYDNSNYSNMIQAQTLGCSGGSKVFLPIITK